jgi:hypothetical protein
MQPLSAAARHDPRVHCRVLQLRDKESARNLRMTFSAPSAPPRPRSAGSRHPTAARTSGSPRSRGPSRCSLPPRRSTITSANASSVPFALSRPIIELTSDHVLSTRHQVLKLLLLCTSRDILYQHSLVPPSKELHSQAPKQMKYARVRIWPTIENQIQRFGLKKCDPVVIICDPSSDN